MTNTQPVRPSLYAARPELAEEDEVMAERSEDEEGSEDDDKDWIDGMLDEEDEVTERAKEHELFGPSEDEEDQPSRNPVEGRLEEPLTCVPCDEEHEPRTPPPPVKPSDQAVAKHECTHIPYRNWCPVCNAAKLKEDWKNH